MADPLFTPQQVKTDGANAIVRTGGQVGSATALVGLGQALAQSRGWLHGELDAIVFGYWVTLVTIAAAAATNVSKLRGKT